MVYAGCSQQQNFLLKALLLLHIYFGKQKKFDREVKQTILSPLFFPHNHFEEILSGFDSPGPGQHDCRSPRLDKSTHGISLGTQHRGNQQMRALSLGAWQEFVSSKQLVEQTPSSFFHAHVIHPPALFPYSLSSLMTSASSPWKPHIHLESSCSLHLHNPSINKVLSPLSQKLPLNVFLLLCHCLGQPLFIIHCCSSASLLSTFRPSSFLSSLFPCA